MSFGLGIGDFIAVSNVVGAIIGALRNGSDDYQQLRNELQSLQKTLHHINQLDPSSMRAVDLNQIKSSAIMCLYPLQEFFKNMQKYDESLGIGNHSKYWKRIGK